MEGFVAWLSENWIAAAGAIASITTAVLLIQERLKREPLPVDVELDVRRQGDIFVAMLKFSRLDVGFVSIESIAAKGWDLSEIVYQIDQFNAPQPTAEVNWSRRLTPRFEYGGTGGGQGSLAVFRFVTRPRSSRSTKSADSSMRARVSLRFRSSRTFRRTITVQSNKID